MILKRLRLRLRRFLKCFSMCKQSLSIQKFDNLSKLMYQIRMTMSTTDQSSRSLYKQLSDRHKSLIYSNL
jgi:hypothetical protein